jgi:hypothetical protein
VRKLIARLTGLARMFILAMAAPGPIEIPTVGFNEFYRLANFHAAMLAIPLVLVNRTNGLMFS